MKYDSQEATIYCIFNNKTDAMEKSCIIHYGRCGNLHNVQIEYTEESPGLILLNLESRPPTNDQTWCFSITASNGAQTITAEGIFDNGLS